MGAAPGAGFLAGYPSLATVVEQLNTYLVEKHPTVFGLTASHPVLSSKRSKVIHDSLWGTVRFSWREMALIDSPIMQRLRDVHQTGLAYYVYPSARHSRFEHSLGATTVASRVFDALVHRQRSAFRDIVRAMWKDADPDVSVLRLKQELRLAALLHDTGHSLYSHTSERVYQNIGLLKSASRELSSFVGKEKGAGEVISFCFALTDAVRDLLSRTEKHLIGDVESDDYQGEVDLINVALMIVGRAGHPFLHFLGDIVSSGFDADKLDYLLRDAKMAGLPLTYDLDRYLYDIRMNKEILSDPEGEIERLFRRIGTTARKKPAQGKGTYPYFDTYRLRLSRRAMNVVEQIIICKMMLFSYIYHHGKCRASEGMLERLLQRSMAAWTASSESDEQILTRFLEMTDSCLRSNVFGDGDAIVSDYRYRLANRLVAREVYSISAPSATHAAGELLQEFLLDLHDRKRRDAVIATLEEAIGTELIKLNADLGPEPANAVAHAGVWVDAPKPPQFENVDEMVLGAKSDAPGIPVMQIFPIRQWTEAYEHYRYQVRIFSFSEYWDLTAKAAKAAMQKVLRISDDSFYSSIRRDRE
jgi:HD superfamily phosphohydrolase